MVLQKSQLICNYCEKQFDPRETGHRVRSGRKTYCSLNCGKLGRAQQSIQRRCIICESDFLGNYQAKICRNEHYKTCARCEKEFEVSSRYRAKDIGKKDFYCSYPCGRGAKPQSLKNCVLCGEGFLPKTPRSEVCEKNHTRDCEGCSKPFSLYPRYKPSQIDNIHPRFCSRSCIKAFSFGLEGKVFKELKTRGFSFRHNDRRLIAPLELDFYLPQERLALEVNDFFSHSKDSDEEPFVHGGFKRGPSYHERKRQLCDEHGVTLLYLWEDEIKNPKLYEEFMISLIEQIGSRKGQSCRPI